MLAHSKWLLGGLLMIMSLFVSSTFETWTVTVCLAVLAVLSVTILRGSIGNGPPRALERGDVVGVGGGLKKSLTMPRWMQWILISICLVVLIGMTTAWRLSNHLGESINPIFVGIDVLAHTAIFVSLSVWVLRPDRGHVSMLPLGLIVMLLCIAGGGTSQTLASQTTVALGACLGFVVASQIILNRVATPNAPVRLRARPSESRANRATQLFSLLTLSLILMATSAIAKATSELLPSVQDNLHEQLKTTFDAVNDESYIGGTGYVRGSQLGSVRHHMQADPQEIALRIYADRMPGYLRGTVFDFYRGQRWRAVTNHRLPAQQRTDAIADHAIAPSGQGSVKLKTRSRLGLMRFPLEEGDGQQFATLEIRNDPLKGPVVFTPLATRWLEANSGELLVTHHGIVRNGVDMTHPYVAGVASTMPDEELDDRRRELLLDTPGVSREVVQEIADRICGSQATTRSKADAVVEFFQTDFSYSMNLTPSPDGVDPLSHFLQTKHPAHCEYFATATVLLLRSAGVPARYVTGYVAAEYNEIKECWYARNRDAHAWAEAYDEAEQRWFAVESTPGRTYRTINPLQDDLGLDQGGLGTTDDWADESESWLGRFWGWMTSKRATDPLMVVFRIAQLPLFFVLLFLLWVKFWRVRGNSVDPSDAQSHRMLRQVDRFARKHHLVRDPHETLHRFAERIEDVQSAETHPDNGRLTDLAIWYRQFANARYRGEVPLPFGSLQKGIAADQLG